MKLSCLRSSVWVVFEHVIPKDIYNLYSIAGSDVPLDNFKDFLIEFGRSLYGDLYRAVASRASSVLIPSDIDAEDHGGFHSKEWWVKSGGDPVVWGRAYKFLISKSGKPLKRLVDVLKRVGDPDYHGYDPPGMSWRQVFDNYFSGDIGMYDISFMDSMDREDRLYLADLLSPKDIDSLFTVLRRMGGLASISSGGMWEDLWGLLKKYNNDIFGADSGKMLVAIDTLVNAVHHHGPIVSWVTKKEEFEDVLRALDRKRDSKDISNILSRADDSIRRRINKERLRGGKEQLHVKDMDDEDFVPKVRKGRKENIGVSPIHATQFHHSIV